MESCRLQCLAQRLLTTFREAVTVALEGTMLSAAPTGEAYADNQHWAYSNPPSLLTFNSSTQCRAVCSCTSATLAYLCT